ncbi:competence/damage-inducible protein A, partial [bacterium]|nr:competence/damage-inducible protein A [bacterium]
MKRYRIAMLTIGQELLNGSVSDTNTAYTAKRLHELGAELALAITVPDDIDAIAEAINWVKDRYDYVITSGGIGPTHDDVT